MRLINDWKRVARKAWSARLLYLASVLSGVEAVLPLFSDAVPRGLFAALTLLVVIGALIARFTLQKELHDEP